MIDTSKTKQKSSSENFEGVFETYRPTESAKGIFL